MRVSMVPIRNGSQLGVKNTEMIKYPTSKFKSQGDLLKVVDNETENDKDRAKKRKRVKSLDAFMQRSGYCCDEFCQLWWRWTTGHYFFAQ